MEIAQTVTNIKFINHFIPVVFYGDVAKTVDIFSPPGKSVDVNVYKRSEVIQYLKEVKVTNVSIISKNVYKKF